MKTSTGIRVITLLIVGFSLTDCGFPPLEAIINEIGTISKYDKRSPSQCRCWKYEEDPESDMRTPEIIRKEGYPAEAHVVLTDDGYLLTMHRIPGPSNSPVVFLQHGLLASSSDWVIAGKDRALAFILADQGYDVWMGNARGNTYSKSHVNYTTNDLRFWDFSWNEMAIYDLPAEIAHVTRIRKDKIIYIGHSMGTTMFFAMSIDKPEMASNVKAMFALAPVAFMEHIKSPVRLLIPFLKELELIIRWLGEGEFLPQNSIIRLLAKYGCDINVTEEKICANTLFVICGFDASQFNYTLLPRILNHSPAGASTKSLVHYAQEIKSGRFQRFDYGSEKNMKIYHNSTAPDYDLTKVQVPVGLFWSENDWLASPIDVQKLAGLLPTNILNYKVNYPKFNHLDFLWAVDAPKLVYKDLIIAMNNWHEMGVYDIPAEIDYISSINDKGLLYIGHSMGTTMFFVMASERPEYGAKVKAMFGLAPVAFTNHIQGPFQALGNILRYVEVNAYHQGMYEFFNQNPYSRFAAKCICNQPILRNICDEVIQAVVGFNSKQSNLAMLPLILTRTPAGTSMKTIMHFAQGIQMGKFRHYDYGRKNMQRYNSSQPPEYDFSKIQTPIALFWGQNDFLAQPKDVRRLPNNLPKKVKMYQIRDPNFNYLDFLWAVNATKLIYTRLMALMDKYRSSNEA